MAQETLPPVPHLAPMLDKNGLLTPVWSDWFRQLFVRVGGHIASNFSDLETVTTSRIVNDAVTADKLADHASVDAARAVTTNHIRDLAVTSAKIAAEAVSFSKLLSSDWTSSKGASGYQKLPSGILIQWGETASLLSGSSNTITFPIAFPTACRQVIPGLRDMSGASTSDTGQWGTGNYTTTSFSLYNRTASAYVFNWFAIGH